MTNSYKIPEKMREEVKDEVEKLFEDGIIMDYCGPWSASVVPVLKPDGRSGFT